MHIYWIIFCLLKIIQSPLCVWLTENFIVELHLISNFSDIPVISGCYLRTQINCWFAFKEEYSKERMNFKCVYHLSVVEKPDLIKHQTAQCSPKIVLNLRVVSLAEESSFGCSLENMSKQMYTYSEWWVTPYLRYW